MQMGLSHYQQGQLQYAEDIFRQVLENVPHHADALHMMGLIALRAGNYDNALDYIKKAISVDANQPHYFNSAGEVYRSLGRHDEATSAFRKAMAVGPHFFQAYSNLGNIFQDQERYDEAIKYFKKSLAINPDDLVAHYNLGNAYKKIGLLNKAIEQYRQSLSVEPNFFLAHNNLGNVLQDSGKINEAIVSYRQALLLKPDSSEVHGNILFLLSNQALCTPNELLKEHREWNRLYGAKDVFVHTPPKKSEENKRLRIGYVSADLRKHAVSYFFEPILANHNRDHVEVFCYAAVPNPDSLTEHLKGMADGWRFISGLEDDEVAHQIKDDQIDILIDLGGHTSNNRLRIFTYKPAPVQVTYLGYYTGTGLGGMDYWLTDSNNTPRNTVERVVESIYRLPRCWVCYNPEIGGYPESTEREQNKEEITFGSFNNLTKITPAVIELWSQILTAVPGSRLLLKTAQFADPALKKEVKKQFDSHGVASTRLTILARTATFQEHLAVYRQVDIGLDPFPMNGGTTTVEALWMGTPVITLAGERFIERMGTSLLTAVGLEEMIVQSPEEYFNKAVDLAQDEERRSHWHLTLRERMAGSPLTDGRGMAQVLENSYRQMWIKWINGDK